MIPDTELAGVTAAHARLVADLADLTDSQARQTSLPRPDETLAALATAAAGR